MSPPTPRSLHPSHYFRASCRACGHTVTLNTSILAATHPDEPFVDLAKRMRCEVCGHRGALLTLNYDDPRYR